MLELFQLEQLVAFADCGTLSKAAEQLHISQPTLTRAMQKLEDEFGVPLFQRTKNKLEFNENGQMASDYARELLEDAEEMVQKVRAFNRTRHTISIASCAPMPMFALIQKASRCCSGNTVSSEIKDSETLLNGLLEDVYQIIVLPFKPEGDDLYIKEWGSESLFFALPKEHPLANKDGLYMNELDGENMLLFSDIGFWHEIHKEKMPNSRFLIQTERFNFDELVQSSVLPSFVSDITIRILGKPDNRNVIPILDNEATATYFVVCKKSNKAKLSKIL